MKEKIEESVLINFDKVPNKGWKSLPDKLNINGKSLNNDTISSWSWFNYSIN